MNGEVDGFLLDKLMISLSPSKDEFKCVSIVADLEGKYKIAPNEMIRKSLS